MLKFIIKRLLLMIPVVLGIVLIVFTIMYVTPGDTARLILGEKASEESVEVLREELGLNDPFIEQYVDYVKSLFTGNLGKSYATNIPVLETISQRFPNTVMLALSGMILSVLVGMTLGVISAVKQYSIFDNVSMVFAMLATSIPGFWLGLMLLLLFSLKLGWFPSSGYDSISAMVLPAITLATVSGAVIIRMTRSSMLEVIQQDYVRTARAKGAKEGRVIIGHALKNAIIPVITVVGVNFGSLLGGAVVTETVFGIPGLGTAIVTAIRMKDNPLVLGGVVYIAIAFSLVNLLVDIIYMFIDPRLRD